MAAIGTLVGFTEREGVVSKNNFDAMVANLATQNTNNANINAELATLTAGLALAALAKLPVVAVTGSGAISPHSSQTLVITKSSAAAVMTLAAPTVTTDDGVVITITSNTAEAHTVTATGLFQDGAGNVNEATFAANAGASMQIIAYQGKWNVLSLNGVTMS